MYELNIFKIYFLKYARGNSGSRKVTTSLCWNITKQKVLCYREFGEGEEEVISYEADLKLCFVNIHSHGAAESRAARQEKTWLLTQSRICSRFSLFLLRLLTQQ